MPRWNLSLDLRCFQLRFVDFHHLTFFANDAAHGMTFTYPAPAALIYEFFYLFPKPVIAFAVITAAFVIAAAVMFYKALVRHGLASKAAFVFVGVCICCSWPLIVVYWLENIEIVIGILVGFGLYFFITGRTWLSATLLSIATAAKIFPFIFLVLFFEKRLYKQVAYFVALAAATNVFALWMITGSVSVSLAGIQGGLKYLQDLYVLPYAADSNSTGLDHSVFGLIKTLILFFCSPYPNLAHMALVARIYTITMGIVDVLLYVKYIRVLPLLNRLLCICILAVLTTPMSNDYTLMHLYVPWGMVVLLVVDTWRKQVDIPGLKAVFVCFILLFCSLSEIMFHALMLGGQIKCLVLIALLIITIRNPFVAPDQPSVYAPA